MLIETARQVREGLADLIRLANDSATPTSDLRALLAQCKTFGGQLTVLQADAAAGVARRERHGDCGVGVLVQAAGLSRHEAAGQVKTAQTLESMPSVRDAVESGDISFANAKVLARASEATSAEQVAQDATLLKKAGELGHGQFVREAGQWTAQRHADGGEDVYRRQRARRRLGFWNGDDGMVHLRGELDPVTGAKVRKRFLQESERMRRADRQSPGGEQRNLNQRMADALDTLTSHGSIYANTSTNTNADETSTDGQGRTSGGAGRGTSDTNGHSTRSNEAGRDSADHTNGAHAAGRDSTEAASGTNDTDYTSTRSNEAGRDSAGHTSGANGADDTNGTSRTSGANCTDRPSDTDGAGSTDGGGGKCVCGGRPSADITIVQHLSADGTDAFAEVAGGGFIPQSVLEEHFCNAQIKGIVFSRKGVPLWHGHAKRVATKAQMRALRARYGGCGGCSADMWICQGHHIKPVSEGGPTNIDNMMLLCWACHQKVHHHDWRVVPDGRGLHTIAPPEHIRYGPAHAPDPPPDRRPPRPRPRRRAGSSSPSTNVSGSESTNPRPTPRRRPLAPDARSRNKSESTNPGPTPARAPQPEHLFAVT